MGAALKGVLRRVPSENTRRGVFLFPLSAIDDSLVLCVAPV